MPVGDSAIFVDAGYLLAEAGGLCCGTKSRSKIQCRYADLITALVEFVRAHRGFEVLRTYWYDGARQAIPTPDHLMIAGLPYVKLRLGRLSGGKQKGVDALIYRDLMTLARQRAISLAYLVAGDEDLRLAVAEVQDLGIQVVALGIEGPMPNQSAELIREAYELILLQKAFLSSFFTLGGAPSPSPAPSTQAPSPEGFGRRFAASWVSAATRQEVSELLARAPRIPQELDAQLLLQAEAEFGPLRAQEQVRRQLRRGFWSTIQSAGPGL